MNPALIASLAAAGLLAGWPQRAVITRLDISPRPPALAAGAVTAVLLGGLAARVHPLRWSWPRPAGWRPALSRWPAPTSPSSGCPTRSPGPPTRARLCSCSPPPRSAGTWSALVRALLGGLALAGFYLLLMVISPSGMSLGDVKLAASLGTLLAWFGWRLLLAGGFAGFLLGGVFAGALLVSRRAGRKQPIPFGPFMIAGAVLAVVAWPR